MEPDVQTTKSHADHVISSDRSRRRKSADADPMSDLNNVGKQEPQTVVHASTTLEPGQEISAIMEPPSQKNSTAHARVDAMKTQISISRAITVELNTLRDMMPKLQREIHTYSINECQLVKELETKLPSCHEHRDVRLNLVLEEIQRLRINKRRALRRLRESQVRVVELESSMESSSYEAGELFWDSKIATLSGGDYSARLNILATAIIEEKKAKENFSFAPVTHFASHEASISESNMMTGAIQSNMVGRKSTQGYFIESTRNAPPYRIPPKTSEGKNQPVMASTDPRVASNANNSVTEVNVMATETAHENNSKSGASSLNLHEQAVRRSTEHVDLEKMVTEARRRDLHKNFRRLGLLIAVLPVATVVGLLLFDWQTGFLSALFSPMLGK